MCLRCWVVLLIEVKRSSFQCIIRKTGLIWMVMMLMSFELSSQNLVLNPSFEELTEPCCSIGFSWSMSYYKLKHVYPIFENWNLQPNLASRCYRCWHRLVTGKDTDPLWCRSCIEPPHTGDNYIENIVSIDTTRSGDGFQMGLESPLEAGREYVLSFWATRCERCAEYVLNKLGIHASPVVITNKPNLLDVEVYGYVEGPFWEYRGWKRYEGRFVAKEGEKFILVLKPKSMIPELEFYYVGCTVE